MSRAPFLAAALALLASGCAASKRGSAVAAGSGAGRSAGSEAGVTTQLEQAERPLDGGPDVQPLREDLATGREIVGGEEGGPLEDIQFDYNQAALSLPAQATLERHAQWLQRNADTRVTIEGHCDERGTVQYNLALGDLRARAVRDFLVARGVADERLTPLSYGKEKPLDPGVGEAAFSRNRRAHFVVTR